MSNDKIIFLGTGSQAVVRARCYRSAGGIVIRSGDNQILIDPGQGCIQAAALAGVNIRETTAVLVSHSHLGHCNDVNAVIDAMTYAGLDRQGVLIANNSLVNGIGGTGAYLTEFHKNCVEKVIVMNQGQKVGINDMEIHALPAKHGEPNAIGFKIFTPNYTLSYTGDTSYFGDMEKVYKDSDILVLNVVNPKGEKSDGNLNIDDAIKIIGRVNPKLAILTHFSARMINADPVYEAREVQKSTKSQIIAAKDGMAITPSTYSAVMTQKRLGAY